MNKIINAVKWTLLAMGYTALGLMMLIAVAAS